MSEYIKIDDLDDTVLRLNNDGWGITRNEHKLISNVLYEMPLYSFPNREKGEWIEHYDCFSCSCCHTEFDILEGTPKDNEYNFCPNCGADMRGKANDN